MLGCGAAGARQPEGLALALKAHGIRLEALDTGNAASTFNILQQEGRRVAAALLPAGLATKPRAPQAVNAGQPARVGPLPNWRARGG